MVKLYRFYETRLIIANTLFSSGKELKEMWLSLFLKNELGMLIITNFSDLDLTKQYTYSDYLLWQFSERVELIRGFIRKISPAPNTYPQTVSSNIHGYLHEYFRKKPCNLFAAPFDVRLPIKSAKKDTTVVQLDLCVICDSSKLDIKGAMALPI